MLRNAEKKIFTIQISNFFNERLTLRTLLESLSDDMFDLSAHLVLCLSQIAA